VAFWTVHGAFTFAEFFIDFFVFIIPMYYEAKVLFLVWLVHNNFSGALFFFDNFIDEILSKHELDIDASLDNSRKALRRQISAGVGALADVAAQAGVAALRKVCCCPPTLHLSAFSHPAPLPQSHTMVLDGLARPEAEPSKKSRYVPLLHGFHSLFVRCHAPVFLAALSALSPSLQPPICRLSTRSEVLNPSRFEELPEDNAPSQADSSRLERELEQQRLKAEALERKLAAMERRRLLD
jgi:hypothetical protein